MAVRRYEGGCELSITLRRMSFDDIPEVVSMLIRNKRYLIKPEWCYLDSYLSEMNVKDILAKDGFGVICEVNKHIAGAAFTLYYHHDTKAYKAKAWNLEEFLGITKGASMDLQLVDESYYGYGIQRLLINECESLLCNLGYHYAYCTVHPDNTYSYNNLYALDYKFVDYVNDKYGKGYNRYVLIKDLKEEEYVVN